MSGLASVCLLPTSTPCPTTPPLAPAPSNPLPHPTPQTLTCTALTSAPLAAPSARTTRPTAHSSSCAAASRSGCVSGWTHRTWRRPPLPAPVRRWPAPAASGDAWLAHTQGAAAQRMLQMLTARSLLARGVVPCARPQAAHDALRLWLQAGAQPPRPPRRAPVTSSTSSTPSNPSCWWCLRMWRALLRSTLLRSRGYDSCCKRRWRAAAGKFAPGLAPSSAPVVSNSEFFHCPPRKLPFWSHFIMSTVQRATFDATP